MKSSDSMLTQRMTREMQVRNYSERSIKSYTSLLSKIVKHFGIPLDQISGNQVKDYLHHRVVVEKVSTSAINQTISAFKILHEDVLGREWETIKIKRPRRNQKLPVVLSLEEVEKLISATLNLKHKALLALAYSSGVRREEAQQMKPSNIDSSRMCVNVTNGKGRKDRRTILSKKALELLRTYYKAVKPSVYLFESNQKKGGYLSGSTLDKIVKRSAEKAGIQKKISFHTLRHTFATHLLEAGVNIKLIQKFLGHSSIKTTMIYLHIANVEPGSISSPLDDLDI
ncbi:MAG: site-specific integrase [Bacteroidales bacterium]|jgi:site-specific recombinase XerD|nr:site-specific integrase [Bacteroidales bacterium]